MNVPKQKREIDRPGWTSRSRFKLKPIRSGDLALGPSALPGKQGQNGWPQTRLFSFVGSTTLVER